LVDNQEIPATGRPPASIIKLQLTPAAGCPGQVYRFRNAQITLMRNKRPVLPTLLANQPLVSVKDIISVSQPGDRIYIFIPYKDLAVVSADGKLQPYRQPQTAEAKGISFTWLLTQK
jgi:hypothetical protein